MSRAAEAATPPHLPRNIDEAFDWLRKHFDSEAARGVGLVYQYDLRGASGGIFHACVDDGRLELERGAHEAADVLYFTLAHLVRADVSLADVEAELDRRALRVTRRPGDVKASERVS